MKINYICEQCFPGAVEIARFGSFFCLCVHEGSYFLCDSEGHHKFFVFPDKPIVDPDPSCEDDSPQGDEWLNMVDRLDEALKMHATSGYELIKCAKEEGWLTTSTGCRFSVWFMNWAGRKIAES